MTTPLPLFENARFEVKLYTKKSPQGDPYSVGLVSDSSGNRHSVLIDANEFDLDKVEYLSGLNVRVTPTSRGIRLKPLNQQPDDLINALTERISKNTYEDRVVSSELIEKSNSFSNAESIGDQTLSVVPVLRGLISRVAEECQKRQLASASWIFSLHTL